MSTHVATTEATTTTDKPARVDVYTQVTNRIIEPLEQGVTPNGTHFVSRMR